MKRGLPIGCLFRNDQVLDLIAHSNGVSETIDRQRECVPEAINNDSADVWCVSRVSSNNDQPNTVAFLWYDGAMYDLNILIPGKGDWDLTGATDINDAGQIVGVGRFKGREQGFVLSPGGGNL